MTAPPKKRSGPSVAARAATKMTATVTSQSSRHYRQDGYTAPTAEDRREDQLLAELQALGYGITVPCLVCRRPLTSPRSLRLHVGPVCAARAVTR